MQYVCDASAKLTWFRIETEGEAARESADMAHAVEKHFRMSRDSAARSWKPPAGARYIEQDIGKADYIKRAMPIFLTLRDDDGAAHVTAMLPPLGCPDAMFRPVIVGRANADPWPQFGDAIEKLAVHYKIKLEHARCYPYRRD